MRVAAFSVLILSALLVLVVGCAPATPPPTATPVPTATTPPEAVTLQYIGHSSILLIAPDGTRILSDPYGTSYPEGLTRFPTDIVADAQTISHMHLDHSNTLLDIPEVFVLPGTYQVGMVNITGYESDHGLLDGESTGMNTVFVFEIGQIKIVHMGGAGIVTQDDLLAAMQDADVVLLYLYGNEAHPQDEQIAQLQQLNVRTIIPSHYSLSESQRYFGAPTLDEVLEFVPADMVVERAGSEIQVIAGMPQQVVVMTPLTLEEE